MNRKNLLLSLALVLACNTAHASEQLDTLWNQGKWAAAASQAADEKDFLGAAVALNRLQECPSAAQPAGQVWDLKLATQGVAYARSAVSAAQTKPDKVAAYTALGNLLGLQSYTTTQGATSITNMREGIALVRQSKAAYEAAAQLDPTFGPLTSTFAFWHARGYIRAGVIMGASLSEARHWLFVSQKSFNQMPEQTAAQVVDKAWTALRIAETQESLKDKSMLPYFEAAIKLGDRVGNAEGRCAANVARVHLGRTITSF